MMDQSFFVSLGAWNWFILAAVLVVFEVLMPGFLLMWYAAAAVLVGAIALTVDLSWQWQLALYASLGMILLLLSSRLASQLGDGSRPLLNRRAQAHIGKSYALATATSNGRGKLKVGDSLWSVRLEDGDDQPQGATIIITGADGITLIGKPQ